MRILRTTTGLRYFVRTTPTWQICRHVKTYSTIPTPPPQEVPPPVESLQPRPRDLRSQFGSAPPPPSPSIATQATPRRPLRVYIYATLFLVIGMTTGQYMRWIVSPPPLPAAGSREDELMVDFIHKEGEKLPIVKSLSGDPAWEWYDAYESLSPDERSVRLTTGPLAGAKALGGFQRVFTNKSTGEFVTVVWFGGALAGWPGVTHGGLVATVMDEQFGRCAVNLFPSGTGVTANLDINYRKPILTNSYYVVKVTPNKETFTDHKGWVEGRVETLDGKICVEGKGLFVVPKKYQTKKFVGKF